MLSRSRYKNIIEIQIFDKKSILYVKNKVNLQL